MTTPLYSLSISARLTLDLHSLNNEGGEGNQIQTRMVNVIDQNGELHNVNAISGDMFKHIQAEHLFRLAKANSALPLCAGCANFNANRINADPHFQSMLAETETHKDKKGKNKKRGRYNDVDVIDYVLRSCAIDDIEGILITSAGKRQENEVSEDEAEATETDTDTGGSKKRSIPRKSVVEFGWVVGLPGSVETDSYFHVKYSQEDRAKTSASREEEAQAGSNLGQAIFHRPTSSGIYAAICHLELARIGFNDIKQEYAIDAAQRALRARALLESVLYTFMQPNGAMRSAQAPHIVAFSGVVSVSSAPVPAPTISPLKDNYAEQISSVAQTLNTLTPDALAVYGFNDLGEFAEIITELIHSTTPYELQYV